MLGSIGKFTDAIPKLLLMAWKCYSKNHILLKSMHCVLSVFNENLRMFIKKEINFPFQLIWLRLLLRPTYTQELR